jgi:transcriptional regulator with XRE-family HTH domain
VNVPVKMYTVIAYVPLIIDRFLASFTLPPMGNAQKKLGEIAKEYRERSGLTQAELSVKLGYKTAQFVSKYERGESPIPTKTLGQLILILGIPEKAIIKLLIEAYKSELSEGISIGKTALSRRR